MNLREVLLLEPYTAPTNITTKSQECASSKSVNLLYSHMVRLIYKKHKIVLPAVYSVPLGLAQLSSVLKKEGISTHHIPFLLDELNKHLTEEEIEKRISSFDYDSVWLSVGSPPAVEEVLRFAQIIKTINSDTPIMVGGVLPSMYPDFFLSKAEIDFLIRGPGEVAVRQYVKDPTESNYKDIQGFCYKNNGSVKISPQFAVKPDLTKLPPSDLEGLNIDDYMKSNKFGNVQTARGCPYNCPYCFHSKYWGLEVDYKPIKNIKQELKTFEEHGCEVIFLTDSTFTLHKKAVQSFVDMYEQEKLSMRFILQTRADQFSQEDAQLINKLKPVFLFLGGESGSREVLKNLRGKDADKGRQHVKTLFKALEYAKKYDLICASSWIIGLPGESEETVKQTGKVLYDLTKAGMDCADIRILQIYPGSDYYNSPEKWGLKINKRFSIEDRNFGNWGKFEYCSHSTEHMTGEEIMKAAENVRLELLKLYSSKGK